MQVIKECFEYYGMEKPAFEYLDSLEIAKKTWPEFESHRLVLLGEHFQIKYLAHDALEDSRTCGKVIQLAAQKWNASDLTTLLSRCSLEMRNTREL